MHTILLFFLKFLSKSIIRCKKPYIIGITGSVGKTTVSHAIAQVLIGAFGEKQVGFSRQHYNGEYGLPLTIIGAKTGGKNIVAWMWVALVALWRLMRPYPKYLILEYGIDSPGEMTFLCSIAPVDIAVITPIEANHIEQFGSLERYRDEKLVLLEHTREAAILHETLAPFLMTRHIPYFFYGRQEDATIYATNIIRTLQGTSGDIYIDGDMVSLQVASLGGFQIENTLPAFLISDRVHIPRDQAKKILHGITPETGRSGIFEGKYSTTIIDGSYNGGYASILGGVRALDVFFGKYPVYFLLGDMRELGSLTQELHEKLAQEILQIIPQEASVRFFFVGTWGKKYSAPILSKIFPVETFISSRKAGEQIQRRIKLEKKKTILYAKGSQNTIFLEEGLKYFLEPEQWKRLPRQSKKWLAIKEKFFNHLSDEEYTSV